jgi:hypothetical protein
MVKVNRRSEVGGKGGEGGGVAECVYGGGGMGGDVISPLEWKGITKIQTNPPESTLKMRRLEARKAGNK